MNERTREGGTSLHPFDFLTWWHQRDHQGYYSSSSGEHECRSHISWWYIKELCLNLLLLLLLTNSQELIKVFTINYTQCLYYSHPHRLIKRLVFLTVVCHRHIHRSTIKLWFLVLCLCAMCLPCVRLCKCVYRERSVLLYLSLSQSHTHSQTQVEGALGRRATGRTSRQECFPAPSGHRESGWEGWGFILFLFWVFNVLKGAGVMNYDL